MTGKHAVLKQFGDLIAEVRSCTLCQDRLMHGARPILQVDQRAKILIAGQAPGMRVHTNGVPFDDDSGARLRMWMGIDAAVFYDPTRIAILPMGFCYPGKGRSGDLAPLTICAETWRARILNELPDITLTLLLGRYAQDWHLSHPESNLTETVRAWRSYGENILPLPHPSPRNNIWLSRNSWFEVDLLPELKARVQRALGNTHIAN